MREFVSDIVAVVKDVSRGSWVISTEKGTLNLIKSARKFKVYRSKTIVRRIKDAEFTSVDALKSYLLEKL